MTRKSDVELLPHARYDQRWEGARVNLEQQWKEILQSIARSPKEATAVAEATMRYAAQPAAFGIEGGVAERAALCFLADNSSACSLCHFPPPSTKPTCINPTK